MKNLLNATIVAFVAAGLATAASAQDATTAFQGGELLPPGAQPGECYTRLFVPPTYKTVAQDMLKSEASQRVEIMPARYAWAEERVLVKEPSERLEVVPATYGWVEEQVLVKSASTRIAEVAAVHETVTEKVLDRPAHTVWKKGRGLIEKVNHGTGEIMCLVEVPATYKTVTKRVLVKPATTREVTIPAEYKTVRRRIMKTPPTTRKIDIPAEYSVVKVRKLVEPARSNVVEIPASYQTVTRREQVTEGRMEWRRIMCETNITSDVVLRIQKALKTAGHNPGPIDGVLGKETMGAVEAYQKTKGLSRAGLTYEVVESLGVKVRGSAS